MYWVLEMIYCNSRIRPRPPFPPSPTTNNNCSNSVKVRVAEEGKDDNKNKGAMGRGEPRGRTGGSTMGGFGGLRAQISASTVTRRREIGFLMSACDYNRKIKPHHTCTQSSFY